ncbi:MAG: amidohydrolase family protein [Sedimentibacter sp.]|uniref:metal-dependent hydrolase family protein n=1 Tax=Sedimentibacter sp. TaxID=1960295 RepID=UPI0031584A13
MNNFININGDCWLINANYVDVINGSVKEKKNIRINDGVISEIRDSLPENEGDVVDCSNVYLTPGLIDMHVHITWDGGNAPVRTMLEEGNYVAAIRGLANAQDSMKKGVTTIREVGSPDDTAIDISNAIRRGIVKGPNMIPAGRIIQCTGGHVPEVGIIADTSDEIMKAIRYLKAKGAAWIKVAATGGAYGPEEIGPVLYTQEELALIVKESHRLNMKVAAHALSEVGIRNCIDAGIDTIEHGAHIEEESLKKMVEKGLALIPTLSVYQCLAESKGILPQNIVDKAVMVVGQQKKTFKKAVELGVRIALGTDAGSPNYGPHPSVYKEMLAMHEYGMIAADVIRCATINAAQLLNNHSIGVIEEGRAADMVALKANPLEDLEAFGDIVFVLKDGNLV